jgi:hypothetical protein
MDVLKPRGSPPPSNHKMNTFLLNPGPNTDPSSQKKVLHLAQINLGIISCLEIMDMVRHTGLEGQHTSPQIPSMKGHATKELVQSHSLA